MQLTTFSSFIFTMAKVSHDASYRERIQNTALAVNSPSVRKKVQLPFNCWDRQNTQSEGKQASFPPLHQTKSAKFFFFSPCSVLFTPRLTCAVWRRPRPSAVGQALACGRAAQQIALHAGVHDGVREGGAVQAGDAAVRRRCRVTALHR